MLTCPACGVAAISKMDRRRMFLLQSLKCPACSVSLRIKWARLIALVSLAAAVPLAYDVYRVAHGASAPPPALYLLFFIGIVAASRRLQRLPLEPS
jgi:hypothetical protein